MNDFLITFKFLIKQNLSLSHFFHKVKTDKKSRNLLIIIALVIIACLPSYIIFMGMFTDMFKAFQTLQVQYFFLVIAIIISIVLILIFGMFQFMSYFYFSNEVKLLTPLPIKPSHYLISKFFVIYIWEQLISVFLILPFFIIFGIYEHIYIYQWVMLSLSFILLPIIPLVVIGVFTVLLMSWTNIFKSKDTMRMVGYILLLVGVLFLNFKIRDVILKVDSSQTDIWQNMINNISGFLDKFSLFYPVSKFVEYAITGTFLESLLSVMVFLAVTLGVIYLFSLFLQSIYIESYLREQNNPTIKKKINKQKYANKKGIGSTSKAIAKIDFITLLKVPIYALNSFAIIVILPVVLFISMFFMNKSTDSMQLNGFLDIYAQYRLIFWLIFSAGLAILAALMPIASTTFSREGKNNWIMRTLPISPKNHIMGRLYVPFFTQAVFNFVMIVLILLMLNQGGISIIDNIIYSLITLVLSLSAALPLLLIGIFIDLKRPSLKWDNPQQAIKQNMNVIMTMGIGIIYGTILYFLYRFFNMFLPIEMLYLLFLVFDVVLSYIIYKILLSQFNKSLVVMD